MLKKFRRNVEYTLAYLLVVISSLIVKNLPLKGVYAFARFLGLVWISFDRRHRMVAQQNLRQAFAGEKTEAEIQKTVRECFNSMATSGVEMLYVMGKPDSFIKQRFRLKNLEHLQQAAALGKGVILVSAHFGNFPLILPRLSLEGFKTAVVMRPMKEVRVERFFDQERRRYDIRAINTIPRSACVPMIIRSLRNQEIVFIPIDQNFGTAGVFVDFFGRKAATATGPVVLAQRSGAAIVPCFIIRGRDNRHTIIFEPAVRMVKMQQEQQTIAVNIQRLTTIIESYVRAYPAEWGWIHRRWKAKMRTAGDAGKV